MPKVHVKKGDEVYILTGRNKGDKGKVLEVHTKTGKVTVDGINMVKKHKKPRPPKEAEGGIKEEPAPIDASNVKLSKDAKAKGKPTAAKAKSEAGDKKAKAPSKKKAK